MLIKYIKNDRNEKIGAVVSPCKNRVGISMCNPKDRFDKRIAVHIAGGRALASKGSKIIDLPHRPDCFAFEQIAAHHIKEMYTRSEKYYQDQ